MEIQDIKAGNSYACKFKVTVFVDEDGNPVDATNLQIGQTHPGSPGEYEGLGVISVRDLENKVVKLTDTETQKEFVVPFENCWDVDEVEWK